MLTFKLIEVFKPLTHNNMKKFNKEISITVQVDAIANKLLDTFKDDNPHKEMLTELIIGSTLSSGHIGFLYNNLNGWVNELDFKAGDAITAEATHYSYVKSDDVTHTALEQKRVPVGLAQVVEVDILRNGSELRIEFTSIKSDGSSEVKDMWVSKHSVKAVVSDSKSAK